MVHSHLERADPVASSVASGLGIPMVSTLHLVEDDMGVLGRLKRDLGGAPGAPRR